VAGYDSMIYASRNTWTGNRWDGEFLNANYRTWLAVWYKTTNYMVPTFGTGNTDGGNTFKSKHYAYIPNFFINGNLSHFLMWQYSDSGRIDGISGNVDLDMCFYIPEEYEGYESPLKINVSNPVINTYVDNPVDVMEGITATNVLLVDKTHTVTYSVMNSLGAEVSLEDAIKHTGTYDITYAITDITWCVRYNYAKLVVYKDEASIPTIEETTTENDETTGEDDSTDETTTIETSSDETTTIETSSDETTTIETSSDETTTAETSSDETTTDSPAAARYGPTTLTLNVLKNFK